MAPRRVSNPGLTLGFYGSGQTSLKGAVALLEDLIEANGGKARVVVPATEDAWGEGIEAVADWALEAGHPLEVITDDSTTKAIKPYLTKASKTHKSAVVGTKLAQVLGDASGRLIIFWDDENDTLYDVIEAADEVGVGAFDICAGLEKIELSDEPAAEASAADDEEPGEDEITEKSLAAADNADIEALADQYGIDPEAYDDWDEVRQAILLAARAQDSDQERATAGLPTSDEVEGWDFDRLKAFAAEHGIDVAPRSRTSGYKNTIVGWLGQQEEEEGYVAPEDEPLDLPGDVDTGAIAGAMAEAVVGALKDTLDGLGQMVGRLGMSVDKLTVEVNESYAQINAALDAFAKRAPARETAAAPAKAPQKATSAPQKAAAAKKAPSKPTGGPEAVAPPQTKGEEVMASVLKWADADVVTKITATKILGLWEQRPKGRPTERERKLYALARSVIPEEKRPVGRPRKT